MMLCVFCGTFSDLFSLSNTLEASSSWLKPLHKLFSVSLRLSPSIIFSHLFLGVSLTFYWMIEIFIIVISFCVVQLGIPKLFVVWVSWFAMITSWFDTHHSNWICPTSSVKAGFSYSRILRVSSFIMSSPITQLCFYWNQSTMCSLFISVVLMERSGTCSEYHSTIVFRS